MLLLPVERTMIVILAQYHLRHQSGPSLALLNHLRGQGRDAHRPFSARAGQLGSHDLVANEFGGHIFKTLTAFTADFTFGLAALRADLFFGLDPPGDRLQDFDRSLATSPWLAGIWLQPH